MELTINNAKLEEIMHWINTNCDEDTIIEQFDTEYNITAKDVREYLIDILESNLAYDFGFDYGILD